MKKIAFLLLFIPCLLHGQRLDKQLVSSFTDTFFKAKNDYAALAISIVQNDSVLYEAGFGSTGSSAVTPGHTVFGAASVSKLFTATAVMQLVEKEKIRLHDDVSKYFKDFEIINPYPGKVTVLQLLTHSAGIEDGMIGAHYTPSERAISLKEFFSRIPPKVIFQPGSQVSYSNRGMSLAGYLVEIVSGMPFYEYVEKNIFVPLQMNSSSFRQPLPKTLKKNGLQFYNEEEVRFVSVYPSASLFTTVNDMSRFMMAHLKDGRYKDTQLLLKETIELMHKTAFTPTEDLNCMAIGFMEARKNGYEILYHTGSRFTSSLFVLIPQVKLGIYIVLNGNPSIRKDFLQGFMSKFLPGKIISEQSGIKPGNFDFAIFKGTYRANVGARTTVEMLPLMLLQATLQLKQNKLLIDAFGRPLITLIPVSDSIFIGSDGGNYYFRKHQSGTIQFFRTNAGWDDPMTFTKIKWHEHGHLHLGIILIGMLFYILTFIVYPLRCLYLKWKKISQSIEMKRIWDISFFSSLFMFVSAIVGILYLGSGKGAPGFADYYILYIIFGLFTTGVLLSLSIPFFTYKQFINKMSPVIWKVYFTLFSISIILLFPVLLYWNLLGFNF